jgi:hypothetical protein
MTTTPTTIAIKRRKARRAIQGSEILKMTATVATETKPTETKRRGRPRKDEAADIPELDLSALTVTKAETMPKQERAKASNPFIAHIQTSFENDTAMAVEVPEVQAKRVESLIRRAADILTETPGVTARVGVNVHTSEKGRGWKRDHHVSGERAARPQA